MRIRADMVNTQLRIPGLLIRCLAADSSVQRLRLAGRLISTALRLTELKQPQGMRVNEFHVDRDDGTRLRVMAYSPLAPGAPTAGLNRSATKRSPMPKPSDLRVSQSNSRSIRAVGTASTVWSRPRTSVSARSVRESAGSDMPCGITSLPNPERASIVPERVAVRPITTKGIH